MHAVMYEKQNIWILRSFINHTFIFRCTYFSFIYPEKIRFVGGLHLLILFGPHIPYGAFLHIVELNYEFGIR